jgi:FkbM family methyltransferase
VLRYVLGQGSYPYTTTLMTPTGDARPVLYGQHDFFTTTEVFVWSCYEADDQLETFVDFGGNIGISALYFLTRNNKTKGVIFEPLRLNLEKAMVNLTEYSQRLLLRECAVYESTGQVEMAVEQTGRYSGIGLAYDDHQVVPSIDVNEALRECIEILGSIDILKIDIEGSERNIVPLISSEVLRYIRSIYIEASDFDLSNVLRAGFSRRRHVPGVIKLVNDHWPPRGVGLRRRGWGPAAADITVVHPQTCP